MNIREMNDAIESKISPPIGRDARVGIPKPNDRLFLACEEAACETDHADCAGSIIEARYTVLCTCECHEIA